jgi:hypothetical protein
MTDHEEAVRQVAEVIDRIKIAMLTSITERVRYGVGLSRRRAPDSTASQGANDEKSTDSALARTRDDDTPHDRHRRGPGAPPTIGDGACIR